MRNRGKKGEEEKQEEVDYIVMGGERHRTLL